jgi:methionyl-tRNA formyltransferase
MPTANLAGEEQKEKDVTIANKIKPEDEHLPLFLSAEGRLQLRPGIERRAGRLRLLNDKKLKIYAPTSRITM